MNRTIVYVGLVLIVAGVTLASTAEGAIDQIYQSERYTARRGTTNLPNPQPITLAECDAKVKAAIAAEGASRTIGANTYYCITTHAYSVIFKASSPPQPQPVDCVVSEWGAWSDPPFQVCAGTQQTRALVRTRTIVTQPANGGAACPGLVETWTETRQCPGIAILSWTPPTRNTNGSSLTNLAGYRVHYGSSEAELTQTVQIANPGVSSYTIRDLLSGVYYFAVRAYTSGGTESANSNVQSKVIE